MGIIPDAVRIRSTGVCHKRILIILTVVVADRTLTRKWWIMDKILLVSIGSALAIFS